MDSNFFGNSELDLETNRSHQLGRVALYQTFSKVSLQPGFSLAHTSTSEYALWRSENVEVS